MPIGDLGDFIIDALETFQPKYVDVYNEKERDALEAVGYIIEVATRGYRPPSASEKSGLRFVLCTLLTAGRADLLQAIEERDIKLHKFISVNYTPYVDCAMASRQPYGVQYILYYYEYPEVIQYMQEYLTHKLTSSSVVEALWPYLNHQKLKYDLELVDRNEYQQFLYEML